MRSTKAFDGRLVDCPVQLGVTKQDETCDESQTNCHSKNERDGLRRQPVPRRDNVPTLVGARWPYFINTACLLGLMREGPRVAAGKLDPNEIVGLGLPSR